MISPNPLMDPFFDRQPQPNGDIKADHCRQQRQMIRQVNLAPHMKLSQFMFKFAEVGITIGFLIVPGIIILVLLYSRRWYNILIAFAIFAVVVFSLFHLWSYTQKVAKAIERLPSIHGGSWGENQLISVLDWLDSHWPGEHPLEIVAHLSLFEHRWHWQLTFANRPVLLIVNRPVFLGNSPATQHPNIDRISFLVVGSPAPPQSNADSMSILDELEKLGYFVKRTSAGVIVSHAGIELEKLEPSYVEKVLTLTMGIC